jgi:hypothetical protein
MTALILSQIPTNINTVEKLHAWSGFVLQKVNPTKTIVEQSNTDPILVSSVTLFKADDLSQRALIRINLPLDSNYAESTAPMWEAALEISNTDIPAAFKQA